MYKLRVRIYRISAINSDRSACKPVVLCVVRVSGYEVIFMRSRLACTSPAEKNWIVHFHAFVVNSLFYELYFNRQVIQVHLIVSEYKVIAFCLEVRLCEVLGLIFMPLLTRVLILLGIEGMYKLKCAWIG